MGAGGCDSLRLPDPRPLTIGSDAWVRSSACTEDFSSAHKTIAGWVRERAAVKRMRAPESGACARSMGAVASDWRPIAAGTGQAAVGCPAVRPLARPTQRR